jgi:hypothetical protein
MSEKNPTEESTPTQVGPTPGPWTISRVEDDYGGVSFEIDRPRNHWYPPQQIDADARLIAAAPDLLATLKQLVQEPEVTERGMNLCLAAIARAEGRTNQMHIINCIAHDNTTTEQK